MSCRSLMLWGAVILCGAALPPSSAQTAVVRDDIKEICLMDGVGGRSQGMLDCLREDTLGILPGAGGKMAADPRYDDGNTLIFKASRYRISDFDDVKKVEDILLNKGALSAQAALKKQGGLYDFASESYVPPTYVRTDSSPLPAAAAMAGVRINAGRSAQIPIDVCNTCRYVVNASAQDIFIPFRTCVEWEAFRNNPPAGVILNKCALPCPGSCEQGQAFGPTSAKFSAGDIDEDMDPQPTIVETEDENGNVTEEITLAYSNYFGTELPYAMAGAKWPPDDLMGVVNQHVFHYKCYDREVVEDTSKCMTWKTDEVTGEKTCEQYETYCQDTWHDWTETWWFDQIVLPDNNSITTEDGAGRQKKGWPDTFPFHHTGSRPAACENDAEHNYSNYAGQCVQPTGGLGTTHKTTIIKTNPSCVW